MLIDRDALPAYYMEKLERLRPIDDDFMRCLYRNNPALAQQTLRIILGKTDLVIETVETQADLKVPGARAVEADVFCRSTDNCYFDLELEKNSGRGEPHRVRYHSGLIDVTHLKPGQDFKDLPETWVIFLMEHDIRKKGLPMYHGDRRLHETDETLEDGSHILYVNAGYRDDSPFGRLMADFLETDPEKMHTPEMRKACFRYKRTEEGRKEMSKVFDEIREYGEAMGKAEGKAEGRLNTLDILDRRSEFPAESLEETAAAVGCTVEDVQAVVYRRKRSWKR